MAARNQAAFNEKAELRILRRKQVEARIGLSRSTIYDGVTAGTFPKPIRLGAQSVGWLESEIDAWLRERIAASRTPSSI
jgi:prophage regulatory protein